MMAVTIAILSSQMHTRADTATFKSWSSVAAADVEVGAGREL